MIFIPIEFMFSALMVFLFLHVIRSGEPGQWNPPFLLLILLSALQSCLIGLRWGYDVGVTAYLSPIVATGLPVLVYAGVLNLVERDRRASGWRVLVHGVPTILVLLLTFVWREAVDVVLIVTFLGYAVAVLRLLLPGTDALGGASLDGVGFTYQAIFFAALFLLSSALIDTVIFLSFLWNKVEHVPSVILFANFVALAMLGSAATLASSSNPPPEAAHPRPVRTGGISGTETFQRIEELMSNDKTYRDATLNLDRLARKAVIPSRQVSQAINRATGMNVSQYVNGYRIAEACDLLRRTQHPVTEIMFDVGFQTKSNFNREFRRVTGTTPQSWRSKTSSAEQEEQLETNAS